MTDPRCQSVLNALLESIERDTPISPEQEQHLASCRGCADTLAAAARLQSQLAERVTVTVSGVATVAETTRREVKRRSRLRRVTMAILGVLALAFLTAMFVRGGTKAIPAFIAIIILGVAGASILAFVRHIFTALQSGTDAPTPPAQRSRRLYKRLHPGYQLSGVCLGLAQATRLPVTLFRLVFLVLAFFNGIGIAIYILFDLAMPLHPDDRRHLWRFRFSRWLRAQRQRTSA